MLTSLATQNWEDPVSGSRLTSVREISVPFYSQSILQEFEESMR